MARDKSSARDSGFRFRNALLFATLGSVLLTITTTSLFRKSSVESLVNTAIANAVTSSPPQPTSGAEAAAAARWLAIAIPEGTAVALPSVRINKDEDAKIKRSIYGGAGDKKHLGGFTEFDPDGVSPAVWRYMISTVGVKSLLDVGCGRGISTSWFKLHGVETICAEGSHDAVEKSMVPEKEKVVVEHDFSRGPWWPSRTVDAVWCVEFTEHVGRNFHQNYIPAFRKAALIFVSHSRWGGWHHVEVHMDPWWKTKFEMYGFVYSPELTDIVRKTAKKGSVEKAPNGGTCKGQHIFLNMQVFVNPAVASLPEHAHLMAEPGCYLGGHGDQRVNTQCGTGKTAGLTALPKEYLPLKINEGMHKEWEELVKRNIKVEKKDGEQTKPESNETAADGRKIRGRRLNDFP